VTEAVAHPELYLQVALAGCVLAAEIIRRGVGVLGVNVFTPNLSCIGEIVSAVAEEIFPSARVMNAIRFKMQIEEADYIMRREQLERFGGSHFGRNERSAGGWGQIEIVG